MNPKLFLAYLKLRKLLPAIALLGLAVTFYNQFLNYRHLFINTDPWIVKNVLSGNSLAVVRGDETINLKLCGISGGDGDYLESLINRGNGSVIVNRVNKVDDVTVAEVFVQLKPDYEREIHLNTEMVMAGKAIVVDYSSCPSAEYLEMAEAIKNED